MRSLSGNFMAAANSLAARPYYVLGIAWTEVLVNQELVPEFTFYLDRDAADFNVAGLLPDPIINGPIEAGCKVTDWGETSLSLNENQMGATDSRTVQLADPTGLILQKWTDGGGSPLEIQQLKRAVIYMGFDHAGFAFADAAIIYAGTLLPFEWAEQNGVVSLKIEDLGRRLFGAIGERASPLDFGVKMPDASYEKTMPLGFGNVQRVPGLLVEKSWETTTLVEYYGSGWDLGGGPPFVIPVADHPNDIGAPTGTTLECWLDIDFVTGYFTQSTKPETVPSTFTILSTPSFSWQHAAVTAIATDFNDDYPGYKAAACDGAGAYNGTISEILQQGTWRQAINSEGDQQWAVTSVWGRTAIVFFDATIQQNLAIGNYIVNRALGSQNGKLTRAGTRLIPKTPTHRYIFNGLPARGVLKVEAWGDRSIHRTNSRFSDSNANDKGFIAIGEAIVSTGTPEEPAKVVRHQAPYWIKLNDNRWNAELGHNVATVNFDFPPKYVIRSLDENDIWVTHQGTVDADGVPISNPANVLLECIRNANILDVDAGFINVESFQKVADSLQGLRAGFAITETRPGLEFIQEKAAEIHCVLLLDQGQIFLNELKNSTLDFVRMFDTGYLGMPDNIDARSLKISEQPVWEVATHLLIDWRKYWDDRTGQNPLAVRSINVPAFETIGRRLERRLGQSFLYRRADVDTEAAFWLARYSTVWGSIEFTAYLDALAVQPGDWVWVAYTDGMGENITYNPTTLERGRPCEVLATSLDHATGQIKIRARYPKLVFAE